MSNVISFPVPKRVDAESEFPHPTEALSFMKKRKPKGGGINYWLVDQTGGYPEQCERGRQLAAEFMSFIGSYPCVGNGHLLSDIVHSMIERAEQGGGWSGVHLGFLHEVSRYVMAAATLYQSGELDE